MKISETIKRHRLALNKSQKEMCAMSGIRPPRWSELESGDKSVSITDARRLYSIGISAETLLGKESES